MELKKLENRQHWILAIDGHKYVRTAIDWLDERPISINWHRNEDVKRGYNYLTDDKLEELFLGENCKVTPPVNKLITAKSEDGDTLLFDKNGYIIEEEIKKNKLMFGNHSDDKAVEIIEFIDMLTSVDIDMCGPSYFNRMADVLIQEIILPTIGSEGDNIYWSEVNDKTNNRLNYKKMENDSKTINEEVTLTELETQDRGVQSQLKITAMQFALSSCVAASGVDSLIEKATKIYNFIK